VRRVRKRSGERFLYEYDFFDGWCHDVRVEAILPVFRLDAPDRGKVIATLRDLSNQSRLLQRFEVRA